MNRGRFLRVSYDSRSPLILANEIVSISCASFDGFRPPEGRRLLMDRENRTDLNRLSSLMNANWGRRGLSQLRAKLRYVSGTSRNHHFLLR